MERRSHKPGQHGQNRRRKPSDFGLQLAEKQKIQFNYGLRERPLSRLVKEARSSDMAAGDKLIELLERRLDNAVFRAGFGATIPTARQLFAEDALGRWYVPVGAVAAGIARETGRPGAAAAP